MVDGSIDILIICDWFYWDEAFFFSEKKIQNAFFACFCPYVGEPHSHVGWATSMPFASINPNNPRTNPWNFHKKILRTVDFEKRRFWKSAILDFFFLKKNKKFAWSPWKSVTNYVIEWTGLNFDVFPCFHQIPCYA